MEGIALQNGIDSWTYNSRLKKGWTEAESATRSFHQKRGRPGYKGEYAVYKNDEIVAMGTREECAEQLGVSAHYIHWMTTDAGKRRLAKRKNPDKATTAVKLDE